ncbi:MULTISPECIES: precorrin-6y C5,15-methyltransferase (decarboxylating) subunit CbiE [Streptomycetaceae]|uniref:precorrin-6y C5,15-methyltransferase (decarboxylating) subunit CbiE n=1 Tax=Streptomycetaceae TaxID=2062 RepID=UPI00036C387C|nr:MULTISPECIES: precorrin-6y C5,15-methyltransferase (decarboxylating) subunit CbiE [Streptomycetaceae]MDX2848009.1 precorrin-6y C5,15-methyltransferase (decarboxylating) subunit CbiE [Streptomyces sp. PA03-3a]MYX38194.1 precorrin-6y C5,15-methyltransferase (decarboxylating) subunit CbiE [Streptomyces sp. SID8377]
MADRVTVIGWDGSPPGEAARSALSAATLVAGTRHHLALPFVPEDAERIVLGSIDLAARRIARHRGTAVVLADGDPGFFGVVRALRTPEYGLEVEVVPGVTSVAQAFARAGMPWDDARVVVAHTRTLRRAVNVCRAHPKVAVLTAPGAGPAELALLLGDEHRTFVICEALGTEHEQVTVLTSDKVADHTWRDPNVVLVVGAAPAAAPAPVPVPVPAQSGWLAGGDPATADRVRGWALPSERYVPGDGPAHLRALQLARLGPRAGDLLWDIGAGGGAVAVEAARFGAAVIAVEADAAACERVEDTARDFGVQVRVVHGRAPHVLEDLPEPDIVRIGGGGPEVVAACAARRPERIAASAANRDEAEAVSRALDEGGYTVECALLQAVELDDEWSERERTVVFALLGHRR